MKAFLVLVLGIACIGFIAALPAAAEDPAPLRRFALVAGSNDGGDGRVRLKYAESDARSFASVIEELGGVRPEDLVLSLSPDLSRLHSAFSRVREMAKALPEDSRKELIVYYSGHSDDEGLILGRERFSWDDLKSQIRDIPADVKVAILDSCSSGSLTRAKGGVARPAFLFDASADMKGHAFLTSSSAEEAAQESDRIGGSFFTHYLVSGLRGAADTVGDGVVTLNEAYAFAFQETLASTEKTEYGPQHPAYDINLTGSGDLVLTDLRSASARLAISEDVAGRLYLRNDRGVLAVELNKVEGQRIELGLEPGVYNVLLDTKSARLGTKLRIAARQQARLSLSSLHRVSVDPAQARGGAAQAGAAQAAENPNDPVAAAAALGAAVGAAVGKAVATAITTTVGAVGGGSQPADAGAADANQPDDQAASDQAAASEQAAGPAAGPSYEAFHFTLLPEVTDGVFASRASHSVSINLLVGVSSSSRGFEVGSLANFESRDMSGFQAAGLGNVVLGDVTGFQAAGLVNVVAGEMRFFQAAGLANVDTGPSFGAQVAGLGNYSSAEVGGAQVGGLFNIGLGDIRGAQIAGLFNWAKEDISGAQVAGLANWGHRVSGPQISVVNIADSVSGAQIGIVNIAGHVSGTQIGLVNISREIDGVPIGLVSVEERGRRKIDLWWDTDGSVNTAISLGSRYFYTVFSAGWVPDSHPAAWTLGAGLGGRVPMGRLFTDADVSLIADQDTFRNSTTSFADYHLRLRAMLGVPLVGELAIEGGFVVRMNLPEGFGTASPTYTPGFVVGMQI